MTERRLSLDDEDIFGGVSNDLIELEHRSLKLNTDRSRQIADRYLQQADRCTS